MRNIYLGAACSRHCSSLLRPRASLSSSPKLLRYTYTKNHTERRMDIPISRIKPPYPPPSTLTQSNPIHHQRLKPPSRSRRQLLPRDGSRSTQSCKPSPTTNNLSHRLRDKYRYQYPLGKLRRLLDPLPPHSTAPTRRFPP